MLKSILVLPDGRELSSGADALQSLMWVKLTESVNDSEELAMGGVFANILEARIHTYQNPLDLTAGDEVILYKEDDIGVRHRIGCYVLDKPTCVTSDALELRAFDRVIHLNRDLTAWLKGLTGWPYRLIDFAGMICSACGLELVTDTIPNGDFMVRPFTTEVTGYQLMRWIGEVCCRFCRANAEGKIELAWYTPAGVSITPSGDSYYLQNSLSYEEYEVTPVDAVQIRLAGSESGMLWPQVPEGANSYIIESNPILRSCVSETLLPVLENIRQALPRVPYRPFRVSIPATLDIHTGDTVQITDKNGVTFMSLVMSREQSGQKDTLECTGSPRRDSVTAQHEMTEQEKMSELKNYADSAAKNENEKLNQLELMKRLTNEWADGGLYLDGEGRLAINASAILTGVLAASLIQSGILQSKDGKTYFNLDSGEIVTVGEGGNIAKISDGAIKLCNSDGAVRLYIDQPWKGAYSDYSMAFQNQAGNARIFGFYTWGDIVWMLAHDADTDAVAAYKVHWKTINGIKTLVGFSDEGEQGVPKTATLFSGALDSGSAFFTGQYSQYVIVGYTTQNQCKVSLTIPTEACDGSLFQLYADGEWVSFHMSQDTLTISAVSNGGAITGIYGVT